MRNKIFYFFPNSPVFPHRLSTLVRPPSRIFSLLLSNTTLLVTWQSYRYQKGSRKGEFLARDGTRVWNSVYVFFFLLSIQNGMLNYETRFVKLAFVLGKQSVRSFTVTPFAQPKTSCTHNTGGITRNDKEREKRETERKGEKKRGNKLFFSVSHTMKKKRSRRTESYTHTLIPLDLYAHMHTHTYRYSHNSMPMPS